jgi:glycosyltransferase involved in cell wall biosynthesis
VNAKPMFSILVVCLNPGDKLKETLLSIQNQEESDYEIIIKDGLSTDGSIDQLTETEKMHIYRQKDTGIYDAMNQAVMLAKGEYIYFLNCGDYFYDNRALAQIKQGILDSPGRKIYYGNAFFRMAKTIIHVPKVIDDFACYRNIPCHQACMFEKTLFFPKGFSMEYKIRADYEFFLRAYFTLNVKPKYLDTVIADYEGGGFSESKANQRKDQQEHRAITSLYMSKAQLFRYRLFMFLTLQKLRKYIAERSALSGVYDKVKSKFYK